MTSAKVVCDHDLERLLRTWLRATGGQPPSGDPFVPEVFVVGSRGLDRWLRLRLAEHLGVAANLETIFVETAVRRILEALLTDTPWHRTRHLHTREQADPWAPAALRSRIARLLHRAATEPEGVPAALRHLARRLRLADGRPDIPRLWELAGQITDVFYRYMVREPEALDDGSLWKRCDQHASASEVACAWQGALWQWLRTEAGDPPANPRALPLHERIAAALARLQPQGAGPYPRKLAASGLLPPRLTLFGLSTIAPAYLRLFKYLLAHSDVDVRLYLWSPTTYLSAWDDLKRQQKSEAAQAWIEMYGFAPGGGSSPTPNPLFAAAGWPTVRLHRLLEHEDAAQGEPGLDWEVRPATAEATPTSLLGLLQQQVHELRAAPDGDEEPQRPVCTQPCGQDCPGPCLWDGSLTVDACHSRLRELELVRHRLAAAIDQGIPPERIVVMAPRIEAYAPLVELVFGTYGRGGKPAIPYTIADRPPLERHTYFFAAMRALALARRRSLAVDEVLDFLALPPVMRVLELTTDDIAELRSEAAELGIHREFEDEGTPGDARITPKAYGWEAGLARGLGSWFLGGDDRPHRFAERGTVGDRTDSEYTQRWAAVHACVRRLRSLNTDPKSLGEWQARLGNWWTQLLAPTNQAEEVQRTLLLETFAELVQEAGAAASAVPVDARTLERLLTEAFERAGGGGYLRGGVTFCSLRPLRSVPFDVVCIVGLDPEAFPPVPTRPAWDLTSRQAVDSYAESMLAFLEAVMAARKRLHLTWRGRDPQTNERLAASPAVERLLEAVAALGPALPRPVATDEDSVSEATATGQLDVTWLHEHWVGQQPRHPFDGAYFRAEARRRLLGADKYYAPKELERAARVHAGHPDHTASPPRRPGPCWHPPAEEPLLLVPSRMAKVLVGDLGALLRAWGLEVPDHRELSSWPPTALDPLLRWQLQDRVRRWLELEVDSAVIAAALAGSGRLPLLPPATQPVHTWLAGLEAALKQRADLAPKGAAATSRVELTDPPVIVAARHTWLDVEQEPHLVLLQVGADKPHRRLAAWIEHLVANAGQPAPVRTTVLVLEFDGANGYKFAASYGLPPLPGDRAREKLATLARLYQRRLADPLPIESEGVQEVAKATWLQEAFGQQTPTTDPDLANLATVLQDHLDDLERRLGRQRYVSDGPAQRIQRQWAWRHLVDVPGESPKLALSAQDREHLAEYLWHVLALPQLASTGA